MRYEKNAHLIPIGDNKTLRSIANWCLKYAEANKP